MMLSKVTQSKWTKNAVECLYLTFILGLCLGVVLGLLRAWKYDPGKMLDLIFYTLNFSINQTLLVVFLLISLYLLMFFLFYRVIADTKWVCFVSSAIVLLPVFLYSGYRINKEYVTGFFELKSIILNLVIGLGFIGVWILVSIGLLSWTRLKILNTSVVKLRVLGLLLGIVVVFNTSLFLFYRIRTADSPNVIILLIDCLRADHVGSYGYSRNTTPNIDSFAKDAVVFTQAISQSTFTKTSIASLFTSRNPYKHGVYKGTWKDSRGNITSDVLGENEITLAEALLQDGFLTTGWIEQVQLSTYMGFAQGFLDYNEELGEINNINNNFIDWAKEVGKKHKFFAYIHYLDLHDPYRPEPPYDAMYGVYSDFYSDIDFKNWGSYLKEVWENKRELKKKDIDQLMAYYDGLVTYMDREIGFLFRELKNAGLYDNTLIIVTADHGDGFMEHGFISHNTIPYEELIRVPLIIKFPNSIHGGKVVKSQVRLIDIMPTILDFLKIRVNNEMDGISLLSYLDGNKGKNVEFLKYAYSEVGDLFEHPILSIRTEEFKYIHFQNKEDELYNLSIDPKERNNIIDLKGNDTAELREMALRVVSERKKKDVRKVTVDKEKTEELKALGYIQ